MKIAVTYENGKVFQHFGKTENASGCSAGISIGHT